MMKMRSYLAKNSKAIALVFCEKVTKIEVGLF